MKKVFPGGTCNGSTWRDALIKDYGLIISAAGRRLDA
jgi:hypothetical protein